MMSGKAIVMETEEDVHIGVQRNQLENLHSSLMILCTSKTTVLDFLLVWSILMQVILQQTSTVNVL